MSAVTRFTDFVNSHPAEASEFLMVTGYGAACGLVYGGWKGIQEGKLDALRKGLVPYKSMMEGFYSQGARHLLKIGGFVGLYSAVNVGMQIYRDRDDMLNKLAGGALAGGLFRIRAGPTAMAIGTAVGLGLSGVLGGIQYGLTAASRRLQQAYPDPNPQPVQAAPVPLTPEQQAERMAAAVALMERRRELLFGPQTAASGAAAAAAAASAAAAAAAAASSTTTGTASTAAPTAARQ